MSRHKNKKKKGKPNNVPPANPNPFNTTLTYHHADSDEMDWEPSWALNWRKTVDKEVEMLDAPDPIDYALAQLLGAYIEPKDPKKVSGAGWDYALDQLLGPYWLPVVW